MKIDSRNVIESQSDTESETQASEEQSINLPTLPPPLGDLIREVCKAYKVHEDLPTLIGLSTVSAAIGRSFVLETSQYRSTHANIHALNTAPSGSGKSLTFREFVTPLYEAEQEAIENWKSNIKPKLEAEKMRLQQDEKALLGKAKKGTLSKEKIELEHEGILRRLSEIETELEPPRLLAEDATPQKLAVLLESCNEEIGVFSSDAGDVLSNIVGRYNSVGRTDEGLFLKGFTVEPFKVDRIGRAPVYLMNPCITMCLVTTPDELHELFKKTRFVIGGFLARLLICESLSEPVEDTGEVIQINPKTQQRWNSCIKGILEQRGRTNLISVSKDALAIFRDYKNYFVRKQRKEPEAGPFYSRRAEMAMRIAICIHVLEHGAVSATSIQMNEDTAKKACLLSSYYGRSHVSILRRGVIEKDKADLERISSIARQDGVEVHDGSQISLRNLLNNNGYKQERIELLADRYPKTLKIEIIKSGSKGGRPSQVVIVNL